MKSILDTKPGVCFICGRETPTHRHHIFPSGRRNISERNGFTVYLCPDCHNFGKDGVHNSPKTDRQMKQICQREYEKTHTREEFIQLIGKNYL